MTKKPIKLYFLITSILFIFLIFGGLLTKNFLSEKFPSKEQEETKESVEKREPEQIAQAKAIWRVAVMIGIILLLIFLVFKLVNIKSSRI